jgi:hypothetical protein
MSHGEICMMLKTLGTVGEKQYQGRKLHSWAPVLYDWGPSGCACGKINTQAYEVIVCESCPSPNPSPHSTGWPSWRIVLSFHTCASLVIDTWMWIWIDLNVDVTKSLQRKLGWTAGALIRMLRKETLVDFLFYRILCVFTVHSKACLGQGDVHLRLDNISQTMSRVHS